MILSAIISGIFGLWKAIEYANASRRRSRAITRSAAILGAAAVASAAIASKNKKNSTN